MIRNLIDLGSYRIKFNAARINASLTQEDVCKELNISKTTLVEIEHYRKDVSIDMLDKMCRLYQLPDKDLFFLPKKSN